MDIGNALDVWATVCGYVVGAVIVGATVLILIAPSFLLTFDSDDYKYVTCYTKGTEYDKACKVGDRIKWRD